MARHLSILPVLARRARSREAGMRPVAFGRCAGWLHRGGHHASGRGVVLCAPFGHEAICTRRGWRLLADRIAASGLPVLRFDYPGTGDAAGEEAPGRIEDWIDSIAAAADWMRDTAGVAEVALLGLRLGADLAAAAAARRPGEFAALALLAPLASGRAYRRQLTLAANASPAGAGASDWLEVSGFPLHRSDLDAVQALELGRALAAAGAPRVLLAEPAGTEGLGKAQAMRLQVLGSELTCLPFEGSAAFLRDAHLSEPPRALFDAVADWLHTGAPPAATGRPCPPPGGSLVLEDGTTERPLRFGPAGGLAGILCEPAPARAAAAAAPAVLLLNTGANCHIGQGRMGVRLARRLARLGLTSLRMDAAGIGDSADPAQAALRGDDLGPFRPGQVEDVRAALDLLESQGFGRCVAVGVCSGAHAAFQAAILDRRIVGIALGNLPAFDRDAGGAPALDGGPPPGEHPALRRPRMLLRRLAAEADRLVASRLGLELGLDRAGRWMRQLLARRVTVLLAYSARDRGLRELRAHFGRQGRRLRDCPGLRVAVLSGTDHGLGPRVLQDEFMALLEAQLRDFAAEARSGAAVPPAAQGGRIARALRALARPPTAGSAHPWPDAAMMVPIGSDAAPVRIQPRSTRSYR